MPNTSEQRSRSGLCKRVIRREATETEGLVFINFTFCIVLTFVYAKFSLVVILHK